MIKVEIQENRKLHNERGLTEVDFGSRYLKFKVKSYLGYSDLQVHLTSAENNSAFDKIHLSAVSSPEMY